MKSARVFFFITLFTTTHLLGAPKRLPEKIANVSNSFGIELFYTLNQPGKNVVLSPFSINTTLYMAYLGAGKTTMENMRQVLGVTTSQGTLARSFGEYLDALRSGETLSDGYTLSVNNGMWIQKNFQILKPYKMQIKDSFGGYVQLVDFNKPSQVVYAVNTEISKSTSGKLTEFLSPSDITTGMRVLLTNTYLFKGAWKYPFANARSRQALFYPFEKDKPVMTRTMFGEMMLPYYEDKFIKAISLPLKSRNSQPDMELLLILPKKQSSTPPFNYFYNGKSLYDMCLAMKTERVTVSLPIFTFTVRIPLISTLEMLGMTTPFSPEADFSKITGKKNLFISEFLTESFFSVNEGGITASSGSAAGFNITSSAIHKKAKEFEANHPFLYILRDSYSNVIHFLGEYDAPTSEKFSAPKVTLEPQAPEAGPLTPSANPNPLQEGEVKNPSGVTGNPSEDS